MGLNIWLLLLIKLVEKNIASDLWQGGRANNWPLCIDMYPRDRLAPKLDRQKGPN